MPFLRALCASATDAASTQSEEASPSASELTNPTTQAAISIGRESPRLRNSEAGRVRQPALLVVALNSTQAPPPADTIGAYIPKEIRLKQQLQEKLKPIRYHQKVLQNNSLVSPKMVMLELSAQELYLLNSANYKFNKLLVHHLSCTDGQLMSEHIPKLPKTLDTINFSNNPELNIHWLWEKVMYYEKPIYIDMSGTAWAMQLLNEIFEDEQAYLDTCEEVLHTNQAHDGLAFTIAEFCTLYNKNPENFKSLWSLNNFERLYQQDYTVNLSTLIRFALPPNAQQASAQQANA